VSWRVRGSYFESCNCEAICPCRQINGLPGGRSTYGECLGVLSWLIEYGHVESTSLDGLAVALATRYHDDEPGSPWTFVLYLDARASEEQRRALGAIYTGVLGGGALTHFPWARKPSVHVATRPVEFEVSHEPRRQWLRIRDHVTLRIRGVYEGEETVTCGIPGHEQSGEELVADELRVGEDAPLDFEFHGNCAYAAPFDYAG